MAAPIYEASTACCHLFGSVRAALNTCQPEYREQMPVERIDDEYDRFKIWLGNLGALQRGHSSLDFRLRESLLTHTHVLKLLAQLRRNLDDSLAITTGSRLPFELQPQPDYSDVEASEDDTEDEGSDGEQEERVELKLRTWTIADIITYLYKISFRIRNTSSGLRTLTASLYSERDPTTDVEIFSQYEKYDLDFVREYFKLVQNDKPDRTDADILITRAGRAITMRRRQFRYWLRHSLKLIKGHSQDESSYTKPNHQAKESGTADVGLKASRQKLSTLELTPSILAKSMISGTEATALNAQFDEVTETRSVVSYASTAYDSYGKGVELPQPPSEASSALGFICPYCQILCSSKEAKGRGWRTHLMQDLQPYICTYPKCSEADKVFSSRRQWLAHEGSAHRSVWQCFEHKGAVFSSEDAFTNHLHERHNDLTDQQAESITEVAKTYRSEDRDVCPICSDQIPIVHDLHNHIANHLERIACFAFPKGASRDENSQASSNAPQAHGASEDSLSVGSLNFSQMSDENSTSRDLNFSRFLLETATCLGETGNNFKFLVGDYNKNGTLDLFAIFMNNTESHTTEVHILSGASNFNHFLLQVPTPLHETAKDDFDFALADWDRDGNLDLFAIKRRNTGSDSTEVHVLHGPRFSYYALQTGTGLPETDEQTSFFVRDMNGDGIPDLIAVESLKTSNELSISILSGSSNFQSMYKTISVSLPTFWTTLSFDFTDWFANGGTDLVVIEPNEFMPMKTGLYVLSGASEFQSVVSAFKSPVQTSVINYDFAIGDWTRDGVPDLFAIKKSDTSTKQTEVYIMAGESNVDVVEQWDEVKPVISAQNN